MRNQIQRGENITVPAPFDVASGDGCLIGSLFGVAAETAVEDSDVDLVTVGVFRLPKTSALAIAIGDPVYWHAGTPPAAGVVNKTSAAGIRIGVAVEAVANPSPTVAVRLDGWAG